MPETKHDGISVQILREVQHVNGELATFLARMDYQDRQLAELRKETSHLGVLLDGGSSPDKGIVVRLDRIEQGEKRREVWIKASIGSTISAIVALMFALIKGYFNKHP